jgi:O-antigen ligase
MYGLIIGLVYTIPPMVVLMLNKKAWPYMKSYYWVVIIIYAIEILWIPLNLMGVYAYPARYQELLAGELDMICGTFTRSNMLADFVAFTYFFIVLDYLMRRTLHFWQFLIISIMAFILLFTTGSKLPIVAVVLSIMYCILLFKKDKIGIVFAAILVFAGIIVFLSTNKIEPNSSYEGFNRIVGEMSSFAQSKVKKTDDESTFGISKELIDNYFWSSPIIGHGNSYKGDDRAYHVNRPGLDLSNFKADATFAYYLVEYGLVGTILYIIFYYNVIKCACSFVPYNRKKIVLAVFLFYLLFSATEGGLFSISLYTYAYIYLFALTRYYQEQRTFDKVIITHV